MQDFIIYLCNTGDKNRTTYKTIHHEMADTPRLGEPLITMGIVYTSRSTDNSFDACLFNEADISNWEFKFTPELGRVDIE